MRRGQGDISWINFLASATSGSNSCTTPFQAAVLLFGTFAFWVLEPATAVPCLFPRRQSPYHALVCACLFRCFVVALLRSLVCFPLTKPIRLSNHAHLIPSPVLVPASAHLAGSWPSHGRVHQPPQSLPGGQGWSLDLAHRGLRASAPVGWLIRSSPPLLPCPLPAIPGSAVNTRLGI